MRIFLSFSLLLFILSAGAQSSNLKLNWLQNASLYNNGGNMFVMDAAKGSDGSILTTGQLYGKVDFDPGPDTFTVGASTGNRMYVARYSSAGKFQYAFTLSDGNSYNSNYSYAVALDKDGNAYVAGTFKGSIDFDPSSASAILTAQTQEAFLAAYDKNGKYRYAILVTNSGVSTRTQTAYSIAIDDKSNVYVTGSFSGQPDFDPGTKKTTLSSSGRLDVFFAKYDKNGALVFAKRMGGEVADEGKKILLDKNKNIIVCGDFESASADFDPGTGTATLASSGKEDVFFAKYDSLGNYVYANRVGGARDEYLYSAALGSDNSLALTGSFESSNADFNPGTGNYLLSAVNASKDVFVAKYNAAGEFAFAFSIGGNATDYGADIAEDNSNNIVVTGYFGSKNLDFDPGTGVYTLPGDYDANFYIASYTPAGAFRFAGSISNYNYQSVSDYTDVRDVLIDNSNRIVITGTYSDTLDVDPGAGKANLYAPARTMFFSKYENSTGAYVASTTLNNNYYYSNASSTVVASAVDKQGNTYVAGNFYGRFDFDPSPNLYLLESLANYSLFFAKYDAKGTLLFAKAITGDLPKVDDMTLDNNGNIYISGVASDATDFDPTAGVRYWDTKKSEDNYGHFFAKYTTNGDLVFAKGFLSTYGYNEAKAIEVDKQKNIYVAGMCSGVTDFDAGDGVQDLTASGEQDMFYSKYDSLGNYLYAYRVGGSFDRYVTVVDMKLNSAGDIVISGGMNDDNVDFDPGPGTYLLSRGNNYKDGAFLSVYKNNGSFSKAFVLKANKNAAYTSAVTAMAIDKSDNIYLSGDFNGKVDFDPGAGTSVPTDSSGIFISSYQKNGTLRFANTTKPISAEAHITALATDAGNNLYTGGYFYTRYLDMDFGPDTAFLYNNRYQSDGAGSSEMFLAKYDSLCRYAYSYGFNADSGSGPNIPASITLDNSGNIVYAGKAATPIDFDPGTGTTLLPVSDIYENLFVAKYSPLTAARNQMIARSTAITVQQPKVQIGLYPNPAQRVINIVVDHCADAEGTAYAALYDAGGTCIFTKPVAVLNHSIRKQLVLPALPKGNYFLKIVSNNESYDVMFMKQ